MHIVDETSLLDFYSRYLEALYLQGKRVLILALVREADAPDFYDDVLRYWTSLHDLTGESVVFAVAGPNATQLTSSRQYLRHSSRNDLHSPLFASASNAGLGMMDRAHYAQMAAHRDRFRVKSELDPYVTAADLARSNTGQISQLRDHLELQEELLPCLHLTLLGESASTYAIPLANFHQFSVYSACREIMVALDQPLRMLHRLEQSEATLERAVTSRRNSHAEMLSDAQAQLKALREHNTRADKAFARVVSRIEGHAYADDLRAFVAMCDIGLPDASAKATANGIERSLRAAGRIDKDLSSAMGSLIDIVHDSGHVHNSRQREAATASTEQRCNKLSAELADIDHLIAQDIQHQRTNSYFPERKRLEDSLKQAFERLKASKLAAAEARWDAFISYPSPERRVAEKLFKGFNPSLRVFLDYYCLRPGDRWRDIIPQVQSRSRCTIPVIAESSDGAHFQKSEIDHAINMSRAGTHQVYPILLPSARGVPFGLEQFQTVKWGDRNPEETTQLIERNLTDTGNDEIVTSSASHVASPPPTSGTQISFWKRLLGHRGGKPK